MAAGLRPQERSRSLPYSSDKQRRYMHAKHPEIAARWDKETGGRVVKRKAAAKKAAPKKGKKK